MNKLKSLTHYTLYILLAVVFLAGCTSDKSTPINELLNNRIKLNEVRSINGYRYFIIEVDGKEYLTQGNGGFIEITK